MLSKFSIMSHMILRKTKAMRCVLSLKHWQPFLAPSLTKGSPGCTPTSLSSATCLCLQEKDQGATLGHGALG